MDLEKSADSILDKFDEDTPGTRVLKQQLDNTKERNKTDGIKLHDLKNKLEEYADKTEKFNKTTKDFYDWYDDASKTPGLIQPVGTEPEIVKKQLQEVEVPHKLSNLA